MFAFTLTEEQALRAATFHPECQSKDLGAIGGGLTYTFTPTGLGIVERVKCYCGAELDLTDYDMW